MKYDKVIIRKSSDKNKKLEAVFSSSSGGRTKTTRFGQAGAPDYTITKDKKQRSRYITRHKARENWNDPLSAGALSKRILWGTSTSRRENINSFKKHFNLM